MFHSVTFLFVTRATKAFAVLLLAIALLPSAHAVSTLKTIAVGHKPGPIVVNPSSHLLYVVNQASNTVSIIDPIQLAVKKTIPVGTAPVAIAVNPVANMVYVANSGSGTISAIIGTQAPVTWSIGGKPGALVVDSSLNKLFVLDTSTKAVKILDSTQGTLLATLSTTRLPSALALNIATHDLFVACTGSAGAIIVIDGTTNHIVKTLSGSTIPNGITSISVDPITNVALAASPTAAASQGALFIDAANNFAVTDISTELNSKPTSTAYDPGNFFLTADNGDGNIFFADGNGLSGLGDFYATQFQGFIGLAVSASTNQMGLINSGNFAEIVDLQNPLFPGVYHFFDVGVAPAGLTFDPITSRFFVTNSGDNTVTAVDISPQSMVPAYEADHSGNGADFNFTQANPATGIMYTLRLANLYAINEVQAAQGSTGLGQNPAGVTAIPIANVASESFAVNPAANKIYIGDNVGAFYSVNGATNVAKLLTVIPPTARIKGIAVDSATNQILAWDQVANIVYVLDSTTDTVVRSIQLPSGTSNGAIVVDPVKNLAYVGFEQIVVVDPAAGTVVTSFPLAQGSSTLSMAANPALGRVYDVTNGRNLYVVDTASNTLVTTIPLATTPITVAVNPVTNNVYVTTNDGNGVNHVYIYSGATNALLTDLDSNTFPLLLRGETIGANPLTNTMYIGKQNLATQTGIAAIDGRTNAVSELPKNTFDDAAYSLGFDLGTATLAAGGYSYTTFWLPTADLSGDDVVPISVTITGIKDASTIAQKPLFRTHATQPAFKIIASSNFTQNAAAMVPKHAFFQVDGWQGTWTPVNLTPVSGGTTSQAMVRVSPLKTGQHILYVYAGSGDVSTVQNGATGTSSPVISPIGSVVFTVEK